MLKNNYQFQVYTVNRAENLFQVSKWFAGLRFHLEKRNPELYEEVRQEINLYSFTDAVVEGATIVQARQQLLRIDDIA